MACSRLNLMHCPRAASPARLFVGLVAFALIASSGACSKDSSTPTTPSAPPASTANVAGAWVGTASDSSGPGRMTWQLTQSGASFSGSLTITDTGTNTTGRGTVSGTVSGSALQFSLTVPAGGFDSPYAACSSTVSGTATASAAAITGVFAGSSSCTGTIASGQLNLNKQ